MRRVRADVSTRAFLGLAVGLVLLPPHASAQTVGDPCETMAIQAGAPSCALCHEDGGAGRATDGYPRLAGLNAAYMERQLQLFRDGDRQANAMVDVARQLTAETGQALAQCYAGLDTPKPDDYETYETRFVATGEHLASVGRWSDDLPACNQCHGPAGAGVGDSFPRLAGQRAGYIENQLRAWRDGHRSGDPLKLMGTVAARLQEADIRAVAAYYASLPVGMAGEEGGR